LGSRGDDLSKKTGPPLFKVSTLMGTLYSVPPLLPLSCWCSLAQVIKNNLTSTLTLTLKAFSKMASPFDVNPLTLYIKSPCHIH
ncbi:hypothetical protein, partial [Clostridium sp. MCC353]|uniref:hypothetical protein n=1 Tax=Clostridium sp. MCC353 TaxID=2592646 RepID=UPI001C00D896